jgi:hypothetical protein
MPLEWPHLSVTEADGARYIQSQCYTGTCVSGYGDSHDGVYTLSSRVYNGRATWSNGDYEFRYGTTQSNGWDMCPVGAAVSECSGSVGRHGFLGDDNGMPKQGSVYRWGTSGSTFGECGGFPPLPLSGIFSLSVCMPVPSIYACC